MTSTSEPPTEDAFARAAIEVATAGQPPLPGAQGSAPTPSPGALAPVAPKARKYLEFHPEDWKNHPLARGMNKAADKIGKLEPGTASDDCNLGEAYVFCVDFYLGGRLEDVPPWVPPLLATMHFGFLAVPAWLEAREDEKRASSHADDEISKRLAERTGAKQ